MRTDAEKVPKHKHTRCHQVIRSLGLACELQDDIVAIRAAIEEAHCFPFWQRGRKSGLVRFVGQSSRTSGKRPQRRSFRSMPMQNECDVNLIE